MIKNPNSLLTRFVGLHRVKTAFNPKRIYFVVMGNIFPMNVDIHEIYDLKVKNGLIDVGSLTRTNRSDSNGNRKH